MATEKQTLDEKAVWSTATVNKFPDSSFLYIESGGEKDDEGKTVPRSLRHLPYKDADGKVDLPHLRNAISRLSQSETGTVGGEKWLTAELRKRLLSRARKILSENSKEKGRLEGYATTEDRRIPKGVFTFSALEESQSAQKRAEQISDDVDLFGDLTKNIMESDMNDDQKQDAMDHLLAEYVERTRPKSLTEKASSFVKGIFSKKDEEKSEVEDVVEKKSTGGVQIWKEGGTYRWMMAYSNNFRDDDTPPEIISKQSHIGFDNALKEGEWEMPELYLWHIPFGVGRATHHAFDEKSGFAIAAGEFYPEMEWAAKGIEDAGWEGVSHGMPRDEIVRDSSDDSIIIRHRTSEISALPISAAANKLARGIVISKEINMGIPEEKRAQFVKAFGEEKVQLMEETMATNSKEAVEAGIESKEAEVEAPVEVKSETTEFLTKEEAADVLSHIMVQLKQLDAKIDALSVEQQETKEAPLTLAQMIAHRVVGSEDAKVDGRTSLAKSKPEETKETARPANSSGITFLDNLISLNGVR